MEKMGQPQQHHDEIRTKRLVLRAWREEDLESFAQLNADPRVMKYFPGALTRKESDQLAKRMTDAQRQQGWGFWAVSIPGQSDFIGCIGLAHVSFDAPFTPAVEVGWRLNSAFWNQGYATEGAQAALQYGFEKLHLDEIVAFTVTNNTPSRRVMEKIGMVHDVHGDFDHPKLPEGHVLRPHVLYRIKTGHFTEVWESPPNHFKPYVEVSACYVEVGGKLLFLERASSALEGKTWTAPAGKIETGESPHQAAIRELMEETGIQVPPSQVVEVGRLYVQKPRGMYTLHMFQVHLKVMPAVHLSAESTRYTWATIEELEKMPLVGGARESLHHYRRMKAHRE